MTDTFPSRTFPRLKRRTRQRPAPTAAAPPPNLLPWPNGSLWLDYDFHDDAGVVPHLHIDALEIPRLSQNVWGKFYATASTFYDLFFWLDPQTADLTIQLTHGWLSADIATLTRTLTPTAAPEPWSAQLFDDEPAEDPWHADATLRTGPNI